MPSKCQYEDESTGHRCTKDASYGEPGKTLRQRCKEHALENMVPVHSRPTCQVEGCKKKASCGYHPSEGEADAKDWKRLSEQKKLLRCLDHALKGMGRVKYETPCHATGCHKKRKFGQPPDGPALYCGEHREKGMDNVFKRGKKAGGAPPAVATAPVPRPPDRAEKKEGRLPDGVPVPKSASPMLEVQAQTVGELLPPHPPPHPDLQQQEPVIVEAGLPLSTVERTPANEIPEPEPLAPLPSPPPVVGLSFFGHPVAPPPHAAMPIPVAMPPFQPMETVCEAPKEPDAFPTAAPAPEPSASVPLVPMEGSGNAAPYSPHHLATIPTATTMSPLLQTTQPLPTPHSSQVEARACSPATSPPHHYLPPPPPHHASMFSIQEYPMDFSTTPLLQSSALMTTVPPPTVPTSVPPECPPSMIEANVPLGLPIPTNTTAIMMPAMMVSGVEQQQPSETEEERLAKKACLDDGGEIGGQEKGEGWLDTLATAAMTANKLDLSIHL